MKTKNTFFFSHQYHPFRAASIVSVTMLFGAVASSAQTSDYLYSGSEQTVTLNPGVYDITAYGAKGGGGQVSVGGLGAEMEGQFNFATTTTLTLLVGGAGTFDYYYCGGGGGGSFVSAGTPLVVAGGGGGGGYTSGGPNGTQPNGSTDAWGEVGGGVGPGVGGSNGSGGGGSGVGSYYGGGSGGGGYSGNGVAGGGGVGGYSYLTGGSGGTGLGAGGYGGGGEGGGGGGGGGGYSGGGGGASFWSGGGGGSYIDSSAIADLTEVSGIASPKGSPNGEIIITEVPEPTVFALAGLGGLSLVLSRCQKK
jgi:hypothetical protein